MTHPAAIGPSLTRPAAFGRPSLCLSARGVIAGAVVVGIALRLAAWAQNRSLWLDEVYLALNITGRSLAGLWQPLDHDQGAPVGFLMLTKLVTLLAGDGERALRLVPLVCGLAEVVVFPRVALRLLPAGGAAFAAVLFAVTPKLVYYSAELKQYATDVLIAVVVLDLLTRPWGRSPRPIPPRRLAVVAGLAVWFSHASVFMLAGLGAVAAADRAVHRDWPSLRRLAPAALAAAVSVAMCYVVSLRELGRNAHLLGYWREYFAPLPPRNFEQLGWYARAVAWLFEGPAGMTVADVSVALPALVLFTVGVGAGFRQRPWLAAAVLAPLAAALAASALGRYPFGGRLLLFAVPLLHLGLGAGWSAVGPSLHAPATALALVTAAAVAAAPSLTAAQRLIRPHVVEDPRAAVAFLAANWQPGDRVYLSAMAREPFAYYAARAGLDADAAVLGRALRNDWDGIAADVPKFLGHSRVWLFVVHEPGSDHRFLTWTLEQHGKMLARYCATGAAAYLFDLREPPVVNHFPRSEPYPSATAADVARIPRGGG